MPFPPQKKRTSKSTAVVYRSKATNIFNQKFQVHSGCAAPKPTLLSITTRKSTAAAPLQSQHFFQSGLPTPQRLIPLQQLHFLFSTVALVPGVRRAMVNEEAFVVKSLVLSTPFLAPPPMPSAPFLALAALKEGSTPLAIHCICTRKQRWEPLLLHFQKPTNHGCTAIHHHQQPHGYHQVLLDHSPHV